MRCKCGRVFVVGVERAGAERVPRFWPSGTPDEGKGLKVCPDCGELLAALWWQVEQGRWLAAVVAKDDRELGG